MHFCTHGRIRLGRQVGPLHVHDSLRAGGRLLRISDSASRFASMLRVAPLLGCQDPVVRVEPHECAVSVLARGAPGGSEVGEGQKRTVLVFEVVV